MRVAVLGAGGFLGRHAVTALTGRGHRVVLAPRRDELDLGTADPSRVARLLAEAGAEAVVNATGRVAGDPAELDRGNVLTTGVVVAACRYLYVYLKAVDEPVRLVQLGSAAEYGLPGVAGEPLAEFMPAQPVTPYGQAKLSATVHVVSATHGGELDGVVLRVFNPVGSGQPVNTLAGSVVARIRDDPRGELQVGSLAAWRDVVSARDVGQAVAAAVETPLPAAEGGGEIPPHCSPRVVNVGSGRATRMRELVQLIRLAAGHRGEAVEELTGGNPRSGRDSHVIADVTRAREALGWQAREEVEEAVRDLVGVTAAGAADPWSGPEREVGR